MIYCLQLLLKHFYRFLSGIYKLKVSIIINVAMLPDKLKSQINI